MSIVIHRVLRIRITRYHVDARDDFTAPSKIKAAGDEDGHLVAADIRLWAVAAVRVAIDDVLVRAILDVFIGPVGGGVAGNVAEARIVEIGGGDAARGGDGAGDEDFLYSAAIGAGVFGDGESLHYSLAHEGGGG